MSEPRHNQDSETARVNAEAHDRQGREFKKQRLWSAAADEFRQALAFQESATTHNNLGIALEEEGRLDEATAHYQRALALDPTFAEPHNNLANILMQQHREAEAIAEYFRALVLKPNSADTRVNLGSALKEQGHFDEAERHYREALALEPANAQACIYLGLTLAAKGNLADAAVQAHAAHALTPGERFPHYALGLLCCQCGLADLGRHHLGIELEQDPDDRLGARMLLARYGLEELPDRASESFLLDNYERRAGIWDQVAVPDRYRAPELIATVLQRMLPGSAKVDVADVGCASGLVGAKVRAVARRLVGVDVSPAMLERAKAKGIYDELKRSDLVAYLASQPQAFDAVTCPGTLVHFGKLDAPFTAAATALRDGGVFALTLYPNDRDDKDIALASFFGPTQVGFYMHSRDYVCRVAAAANFSVEIFETEIHEYQNGQPKAGFVIGLRRARR